MPTYYKLLNKNGTSTTVNAAWPLPKRGKPGAWLPPIKGPLVACANGYHVLKIEDLLSRRGAMLAEIEIKGRPLRDTNKSVVRQARTIRIVKGWNEKNLRLFAADCAERALPIWEKKYPDDDRPLKAIKAARAFAKGKISFKTVIAARNAAYDAAYDAGAAAAAAAYAATAAADATAAAAVAAAYAAADAAAARKKERKWQIKRLEEYLNGT